MLQEDVETAEGGGGCRRDRRGGRGRLNDKGGAMLESPVTCSPTLIHLFGDSGAQPRWESQPPIVDMGQSYLVSFAYIGQAVGDRCDAPL